MFKAWMTFKFGGSCHLGNNTSYKTLGVVLVVIEYCHFQKKLEKKKWNRAI